MEVWAECLCACAFVPVFLRLLCALCACVPWQGLGPRTINIVVETYMLIKAYPVYIYIRFTHTILNASSIFNWEGPIRWRMGWPRVAGRGGPRHTRVMMMVIFVEHNVFMLIVCTNIGSAMRLLL